MYTYRHIRACFCIRSYQKYTCMKLIPKQEKMHINKCWLLKIWHQNKTKCFSPQQQLQELELDQFQFPLNPSVSHQFYKISIAHQVQLHSTRAPKNNHIHKREVVFSKKNTIANQYTFGWKALAIPATWVPWGELSVTILKTLPSSYTLTTHVQASNLLNTPYFRSIL